MQFSNDVKELTINVIEEGKDITLPVFGRFNSVVERRSWGQSIREFVSGLPWLIILVTIIQIFIQYAFDSQKVVEYSLPNRIYNASDLE